MTGLDLVRQVFPDVKDDEADYLLWNHTCFPLPPVSDTTAEDGWVTQLKEYKKAYENLKPGEKLCTCCNNVAVDTSAFRLCLKCKKTLSGERK